MGKGERGSAKKSKKVGYPGDGGNTKGKGILRKNLKKKKRK